MGSLPKRSERFLVKELSTLPNNVLPSNREVLGFLLYNTGKRRNLDLATSLKLTVSHLENLYENRARIPMQLAHNVSRKAKKLYDEWRGLQRGAKRSYKRQLQQENDFTVKLDKLFDVAHSNARRLIKHTEDLLFLEAQREVPRRGRISAEVDLTTTAREQRAAIRLHQQAQRQERENERVAAAQATGSCTVPEEFSDRECETQPDQGQPSSPDNQQPSTSRKRKRGTEKFVDRNIAATFDRVGMSNRNMTMVVTAVLRRVNVDPAEYNVNERSIRRDRAEMRKTLAEEIRANVPRNPYVVHWDGKILPDILGRKKVDRVPVLVSGLEPDFLLGVPKLDHGTGVAQANAVFDLLEKYTLTESIQAACTDTELANTGRLTGGIVKLEQLLGRELLYFACRHHMYEVVLGGLFEKFVSPGSSPEISMFVRFREAWEKGEIDETVYQDFSSDDVTRDALSDVKDRELTYLMSKLQESHARDDYRELLQLSVIFLGGTPPKGVSFRTPGPVSDARWMMKGIYCLRMFLFREQFQLSKKQLQGITNMCIFLVRVYVRAWFNCPIAARAPQEDLNFLKAIVDYKEVNADFSKEAIRKFSNHLWYLTEENAALGFFDERVTIETKIKMVTNFIEAENEGEFSRKLVLPLEAINNISQRNLDSFISRKSRVLFQRFGLSTGFLAFPPETWPENEDFKDSLMKVSHLKVVNDTAERGVKLMQEYNKLITNDEEQKQFLLSVVAAHRQQIPNANKETLKRSFV